MHKMILCGTEWKTLREVDPKLMPKLCKVKFTPYGTHDKLDMIGRTKVILRNEVGGQINTMVYIARGGHQSLLGLKDAKALGIMRINKEGDSQDGTDSETVNSLSTQQKTEVWVTGEKQELIDQRMEEIVAKYPKLFKGVGRAQIEPIHILMDKKVKPVQQKQRKVALHFMARLKAHIDELKASNVIAGPLQ